MVEQQSDSFGLPPGTVRRPAVQPEIRATAHAFHYGYERFEEETFNDVAKAYALVEADGVTWLNVDRVSDVDAIETVGNALSLHPLILEDLTNTTQRPKIEAYDDKVFVVARMVRPIGSPENDQVNIDARHNIEQIAFVLGPGYVVSFQQEPGDVFEAIRARLRSHSGPIRGMGADYLLYALIDLIVDHYFISLERIGDITEQFEEAVLSNPEPALQQKLNMLRREVVLLRRAIWPLRDVLSSMLRDDLPLITEQTKVYIRDAHDHVIQAVDILESLREVLSGLADLYLSAISHKMNEVMKVLTVVGTIFIPLSFLTGLYGMNFDHIPELHYRSGYFILLGVMAVVTIGMLIYFRRKRWL